MSSTIQVNGAPRPRNVATVAALLAELAVPAEAKGVAVALNGAVISRTRWAETPIKDGDAIEVIRAMSGG